MRKLISSIVASASLLVAPVAASVASPAQSLSLSNARVGAASGAKSDLAGGSGGIIALVILAGIVAIGVFAAIEESDDDSVSA